MQTGNDRATIEEFSNFPVIIFHFIVNFKLNISNWKSLLEKVKVVLS